MDDLNAFDTVPLANSGAPCYLKDIRTGRPTAMYITVLGMDSDAFQQIKLERARDMALRREQGNFSELTPEERDALTIDTLARLTVGWSIKSGGQDVEFSVAKAREIYKAYPAVREQVNVFMAERANFLPA